MLRKVDDLEEPLTIYLLTYLLFQLGKKKNEASVNLIEAVLYLLHFLKVHIEAVIINPVFLAEWIYYEAQ
jgi:hypothetical protein